MRCGFFSRCEASVLAETKWISTRDEVKPSPNRQTIALSPAFRGEGGVRGLRLSRHFEHAVALVPDPAPRTPYPLPAKPGRGRSSEDSSDCVPRPKSISAEIVGIPRLAKGRMGSPVRDFITSSATKTGLPRPNLPHRQPGLFIAPVKSYSTPIRLVTLRSSSTPRVRHATKTRTGDDLA